MYNFFLDSFPLELKDQTVEQTARRIASAPRNCVGHRAAGAVCSAAAWRHGEARHPHSPFPDTPGSPTPLPQPSSFTRQAMQPRAIGTRYTTELERHSNVMSLEFHQGDDQTAAAAAAPPGTTRYSARRRGQKGCRSWSPRIVPNGLNRNRGPMFNLANERQERKRKKQTEQEHQQR